MNKKVLAFVIVNIFILMQTNLITAKGETTYSLSEDNNTFSTTYASDQEEISNESEVVVGDQEDSDFEIDNDGRLVRYIGHSEVVIIPDNVKIIGEKAIKYPYKISKIIMPSSVTTIEAHAFESCSYMTEIDIPDSVSSIGDYAFYYCEALEKVTLPKKLKIISKNTFRNCINLSYIDIPDSVTSIQDYAFEGSNLISISIPDSVTYMGEGVFMWCKNLKNIKLPSRLSNIGIGSFRDSGLTEIDIPQSVYEIGAGAFYECFNLTSISIPDNVTIIRNDAFMYCKNLESVRLPSNLRRLEDSVFYGCNKLKSVNIPEKIDLICFDAFFSTVIESIQIPGTVKFIDSYAFGNCYMLTEVSISDGVGAILNDAFYACPKLTKIVIPASVSMIREDALEDCKDVIIYGYRDTYAESYANGHNIPFIALDDDISAVKIKLYNRDSGESIPNTTVEVNSKVYSTDLSGFIDLKYRVGNQFELNVNEYEQATQKDMLLESDDIYYIGLMREQSDQPISKVVLRYMNQHRVLNADIMKEEVTFDENSVSECDITIVAALSGKRNPKYIIMQDNDKFMESSTERFKNVNLSQIRRGAKITTYIEYPDGTKTKPIELLLCIE